MKRNGAKAAAAVKRWRERYPEKYLAQKRRYYARNRERHKLGMDRYHAARPEVVLVKSQAYRARLRTAVGSFSAAQWTALVSAFDGRCGYCNEIAPLQADHRVPLARGGTNDISNIVPACGRCNQRKHKLTEAEFRARLSEGG